MSFGREKPVVCGRRSARQSFTERPCPSLLSPSRLYMPSSALTGREMESLQLGNAAFVDEDYEMALQVSQLTCRCVLLARAGP